MILDKSDSNLVADITRVLLLEYKLYRIGQVNT